ncbi:MAG TPA: primosomal replication protein N [Vicinamibacterales bacterium]|nr:primosomal replication protein N [Vicinamibacterales bacterium]
METNRLTITGLVVEVSGERASPAGIPQRRITVEHRSRQIEAGIPREARCRVDVKIAGDELAGIARTLAVGQPVGIEGFLTRTGFKGSEASLVVHATRIETKGDATGSDH